MRHPDAIPVGPNGAMRRPPPLTPAVALTPTPRLCVIGAKSTLRRSVIPPDIHPEVKVLPRFVARH